MNIERQILEGTYEDTCVVYRHDDTVTGNITKKEPKSVLSSICALSQAGLRRTNQTQDQNVIDYDAKLFLPPGLEIKPGDEVAVKRFGRKNPDSAILLEFSSVGRPMYYPTHQEVMLRERGRA